MNNLPNFIIIGAPKSGTTSIFYYLKQHPDIYLPVRKELHYFSYSCLEKQAKGPGDTDALKNLCCNWDAYINHYKSVNGQKAIGEVSPSYLYFSQVSHKIKDQLGNIKIICILRNPIEKAFSQFNHLKRDYREELCFYDALMAEKGRVEKGWGDFWRYAESSLYADRLKLYYEVFGADSVKVVLFDDLMADSGLLMKEMFSFLGIDASFEVQTDEIYNRSGKSRLKFISDFFSKPNTVKSLAKSIIPEQIRVAIRMKVLDMNTADKDAIDDRSRTFLIEYFSQDIAQLEAIIGRKTNWIDS